MFTTWTLWIKISHLGPAVMKGWKSPRKPPWTIGYASTYAGNTLGEKVQWNDLMEVVYPKWKASRNG